MIHNTTKHCLLAMLLLAMCITTINAATYSVAPMQLVNAFIAPNAHSFTARVTNYGSESVNTLTYTLFDTNLQKQIAEKTITLSTPLSNGETADIEIEAQPSPTFANQPLYLNITKVNGQNNQASSPHIFFNLYTMSRVPKKRLVVEDYTGMWCGYCPRGIVTMEYLKRMHPDQFIGIAIHCNHRSFDYLDTKAYGTVYSKWANSFPTLWVNRKHHINDWTEGNNVFEREDKSPAVMDVDLQAIWANDSSEIKLQTTVIPCMGADSGRYGIAYVLIEDGMKNSNWWQNNYFSGQTYDGAPEEMKRFTSGSGYISNMTFDHTAIASLGIDKGMDESLNRIFQTNVPQIHYASFPNLSQYSVIQNKDSLSVVAMVIDRQTNQIDNAAICRIKAGKFTEYKDTTTIIIDTTTVTNTYKISLKQFENTVITPDSNVIAINITNNGTEAVSTLSLSILSTETTEPVEEKSITLPTPLPAGQTAEIEIEIQPSQTYKKQSLRLNITKVDGHQNQDTLASTNFSLYTMSRVPEKRLVVENYTGMWCGDAPMGMATVDYLQNRYPNKFIGINVHCKKDSLDDLDTNAYDTIPNKWATAIPTVWINREHNTRNWADGDSVFKNEQQSPAVMDVSIQAVWANDSNDIDMETTVTACMNADSGRYKVAYILIEDGMRGSNWVQSNNLSGKQFSGAPEEVEIFTNGDNSINDISFNHTAIASLDIDKGRDKSLTEDFQTGVPQHDYASFLNIAQYPVIQHKDSLSVVALVIDRQTNQIDNAAICRIVEGEITGIRSASASGRTTASTVRPNSANNRRYNIYGQPVGDNYKGIVIKDGRKILQ